MPLCQRFENCPVIIIGMAECFSMAEVLDSLLMILTCNRCQKQTLIATNSQTIDSEWGVGVGWRIPVLLFSDGYCFACEWSVCILKVEP